MGHPEGLHANDVYLADPDRCLDNPYAGGHPIMPLDVSTTVTAPAAPTIGNNATAGNASATVNWTAPTDNGGRAIPEYRARVYNSAGTLVKNVTGIPGSATSARVTGLTNGTAYKFKVQASNTLTGRPTCGVRSRRSPTR